MKTQIQAQKEIEISLLKQLIKREEYELLHSEAHCLSQRTINSINAKVQNLKNRLEELSIH